MDRDELAFALYSAFLVNVKKFGIAMNAVKMNGNDRGHKRPVNIELGHMAYSAAEDFLTVKRHRRNDPRDFTREATGDVVHGPDPLNDLHDAAKERRFKAMGITDEDARKTLDDAADAATFIFATSTPDPIKAPEGRRYMPLKDLPVLVEAEDIGPAVYPDWRGWQADNQKACKGAANSPPFTNHPTGAFWNIASADGRKYQTWAAHGFKEHFGPHLIAGTFNTEAQMAGLCPVAARAFAAFVNTGE